MGNCLVTKLKGTVDNPNLSKLGVLTLAFKAGQSAANDGLMSITIGNSGVCKVSVDGVGGFALRRNQSERLTEYEIQPNSEAVFVFENANYNIYISNKYNITALGFGSTSGRKYQFKNFDELAYMTALTMADIYSEGNSDCEGRLESLIHSSLTKLMLKNYPKVSGDISFINNLPDLQELIFSNVNLFGNVEAISEHPSLQTLSLANCQNISGELKSLVKFIRVSGQYYINNTKISGTVEDFVKEFVKLNNSFAIGIHMDNTDITFNGSAIGSAITFIRNTETPNTVTLSRSNLTLATYDVANDTWTYA